MHRPSQLRIQCPVIGSLCKVVEACGGLKISAVEPRKFYWHLDFVRHTVKYQGTIALVSFSAAIDVL